MKEDQEKRKHNRYLDMLDRDIINELQDNGRRPFSEIASKLKVSEGTVRKRVKKLMDMDVFKIAGLIDPGKYGEPLKRGLQGYRKLRVGDYRVIYKVNKENIVILKIGHRKEVYYRAHLRIGS